ncbi:MAG: phage portal protein, partial [Chloroflexi bacterium]|nr:phage portal protein [Chloroflexota bacterium]
MEITAEAFAELNARIDVLRTSWSGYQSALRTRHARYLRAYSPPFDDRIGEHDQWTDPYEQNDDGRTRASYNIVRAGVELWTSLEAGDFPTLRWGEDFIPTPAPERDETKQAAKQETYRAMKLVQRQLATMREQAVLRHVRRSRLPRDWWKYTLKKNIYGLAWLRSLPDQDRKTFANTVVNDPSTVYPVWSAYGDRKLDAILVATRRSARSAAAQYPSAVVLERDGITAASDGYYNPTADRSTDKDRAYVWVEDYWYLDAAWEESGVVDGRPYRVQSRVVNCVRVNEKIVSVAEYPGWRRVPYFPLANEDERDSTGFSDVATMLPFQDGLNRMLSQQQDVIYAESRPRFKYRGDADREINLNPDEVISLDPDEDIDQIDVHLDVFPTQTHHQQLTALLQRSLGLPAVVWGEIQAAQNSGRALSTAWRATAARMVPRINGHSAALDEWTAFVVDLLELYDWDDARDLFAGNRDFDWDFPNKEPRDFLEVTSNAINKLNAGLIDLAGAMDEIGAQSPDEMIERVRADYMDMVLHPEKGQSFLLLQRLR